MKTTNSSPTSEYQSRVEDVSNKDLMFEWDYIYDGNPKFYSRDCLMKRTNLRYDKDINCTLDKFFQTYQSRKNTIRSDCVHKTEVGFVNVLIRKALLDPKDWSAEEAWMVVEEDWEREAKGEEWMTEGQLKSSLFEIADVWTDDLNKSSYVSLLENVYMAITKPLPHQKSSQRGWQASVDDVESISQFLTDLFSRSPSISMPSSHPDDNTNNAISKVVGDFHTGFCTLPKERSQRGLYLWNVVEYKDVHSRKNRTHSFEKAERPVPLPESKRTFRKQDSALNFFEYVPFDDAKTLRLLPDMDELAGDTRASSHPSVSSSPPLPVSSNTRPNLSVHVKKTIWRTVQKGRSLNTSNVRNQEGRMRNECPPPSRYAGMFGSGWSPENTLNSLNQTDAFLSIHPRPCSAFSLSSSSELAPFYPPAPSSQHNTVADGFSSTISSINDREPRKSKAENHRKSIEGLDGFRSPSPLLGSFEAAEYKSPPIKPAFFEDTLVDAECYKISDNEEAEPEAALEVSANLSYFGVGTKTLSTTAYELFKMEARAITPTKPTGEQRHGGSPRQPKTPKKFTNTTALNSTQSKSDFMFGSLTMNLSDLGKIATVRSPSLLPMRPSRIQQAGSCFRKTPAHRLFKPKGDVANPSYCCAAEGKRAQSPEVKKGPEILEKYAKKNKAECKQTSRNTTLDCNKQTFFQLKCHILKQT